MSRHRYLTNADAWRRVAETFDAGEEAIVPRFGRSAGLCTALRDLMIAGLITTRQKRDMKQQMETILHPDCPTYSFWWDAVAYPDTPRVIAATLLALITDDVGVRR